MGFKKKQSKRNIPNQVIERNENHDAFKSYFKDGIDRSYAKTALKFKKSVSTIEKWGSQFNWQERVSELDTESKKRTAEKAIAEQELDYKQRNLRIIKRAILENAKAIQGDKIKYSVKTLELLVNLEERVRTGIDSTVQVNHRFELRGMSNEDIQRRIDEKIEKIFGFRKMKHFKDMRDPIETECKVVEQKEGN